MQETVFACNMNAISPEQRPAHQQLAEQLFTSKQAVHEMSNGYRFEFSAEWLVMLAQFVSLERLCCPFFDFAIQVDANSDTLSLQLTGTEGVKAFIRAEFGELLN
ncbi:MAG: hypothetical protein BroJett018_17820 [Chloroflexota bacterium]|nr:hypothetical protein [Chloroflexota bacterium]NOG63878.1 hypothetical protein [Chloroflexota bacterium]GIK63988.1 MAG: hypothetical protein BroJett018_17820 [Chloroflexota bacterium]